LNRTNLQLLVDQRIADANALLAAHQWPSAYYLAGYSLECALKSCVLAFIDRTGVIFEDKKYGEKCWTHDLEKLVKQAELTDARDLAIQNNDHLGQNWLLAKDWSESSRYRMSTQSQAESLVEAITDNTDGVLLWAKIYW
jgi:hypothetical protein